MRRIFNFKQFLNESSAAGNMDRTFKVPFAYSSHDPKVGYNSKSFVEDLRALFVEKPDLKEEITEFITTTMNISLDDLEFRPFAEVSKIIPEIERIIEAGEYEPEKVMPGGSTLFIRNKTMDNGSSADFYINRFGTKIEVVTEDESGEERVFRFKAEKFPFDRFQFTPEEIKETEDIIKEKMANP
jgi:hypothetical protein